MEVVTAPREIKVLIVDDQLTIRLLIREILQQTPDIKVVGTAGNPIEAKEKIRNSLIDAINLRSIADRCDIACLLSGGLDSAVSVALLTEVVGKDRVYAYSLPTLYNASRTKDNAKTIAARLGIHFQEIPIQPIVDSFLSIQPETDPLTKENIQARVRGSVLMNLAAEKKGVVMNNGNKIEIALGYTTLYGDTIGALAPLGDLTKMQIVDRFEEKIVPITTTVEKII
jgi:NAD+ synthetase